MSKDLNSCHPPTKPDTSTRTSSLYPVPPLPSQQHRVPAKDWDWGLYLGTSSEHDDGIDDVD